MSATLQVNLQPHFSLVVAGVSCCVTSGHLLSEPTLSTPKQDKDPYTQGVFVFFHKPIGLLILGIGLICCFGLIRRIGNTVAHRLRIQRTITPL